MRTTESSSKEVFLKKHPEYRKYEKHYNTIMYAYKDIVWKALLDGKMLELPMGTLELKKFKPSSAYRKLPFDYGEYNKTSEKLKHLNEHTDGYKITLRFYARPTYKKYKFKSCRHFNRYYAKALKEIPNLYKKYNEHYFNK